LGRGIKCKTQGAEENKSRNKGRKISDGLWLDAVSNRNVIYRDCSMQVPAEKPDNF
jgi:hypothetical protein